MAVTARGPTALKYILLLAVILFSLLILHFCHPYTAKGPQLLANDNFYNGLASWKTSDPDKAVPNREGGITLASPATRDSLSVSQTFELGNDAKALIVVAKVKSENIRFGEQWWQNGSLTLSMHDPETRKTLYPNPHALFHIEGTHDWQEHVGVFNTFHGIRTIELSIQLLKSAGIMQVKDLSVHKAELEPVWPFIQATGLMTIFVFIAWLFSSYITACPPKAKWLSSIAIIALVSSLAAPNTLKIEVSKLADTLIRSESITEALRASPILNLIIGAEKARALPEAYYFYPTLHFVFYFSTTIVLLISVKAKRRSQIALDLITLGILTECTQVFIEGRTPSISDALIDATAVLIGLVIFVIAAGLFGRHENDTTFQ